MLSHIITVIRYTVIVCQITSALIISVIMNHVILSIIRLLNLFLYIKMILHILIVIIDIIIILIHIIIILI